MSTTSYIHAPAGNAFLLHEDAGPSFRDDPAVAGNSAGTRFFGAWSREGVLEGRLFNADGTPAADLVTLSPIAGPDAHDEVSVTALADGRFIVSYTDSQGDIWGNIRARLVNADGSPAAILHIDTELNPAFGAMGSAVAALADGGFAVTWTRYDVGDGDVFGDSDIHMQIYNADGSLRHATGPLAADPARSAEGSSTAGLAGGGIVVVCREETIDHDDLRFRRFTADGTALDGASGVLIDAGAAIGSAQVAALPDGGFAIAYQDLKWGNSFDIAARIYNADGSARTAPLYVNSAMNGGDPVGIDRMPSLTVLPSGHIVVGWSTGQGNQVLQAFDAAGNPVGSNSAVAASVQDGELAALGGGIIADVWQDFPDDNGVRVHGRLLELTRVITGDGSNETITGGGDGLSQSFDGKGGDDTMIGGPGKDTAVFSQSLGNSIVQELADRILVAGADGADQLFGIEHLRFADTTLTRRDDGDGLFDSLYYLSRNTDVYFAGADALAHYDAYGRHEGRDPNAHFDTSGYLAVNRDVANGGANPLQHYHADGWREGRDPSAGFDTTLYLLHNPDVAAAGTDPLEHYLLFGRAEGRVAHAAVGQSVAGGFDAQYYLFHNPDVAAAGVDALTHFNAFGRHEGRAPNGWFDTAGYLAHYADVAAAGVNPLEHYAQFGWREGRDASAQFDTLGYLAANPDVAAAGVNPLEHFLTFGVYEGRAAVPDGVWH